MSINKLRPNHDVKRNLCATLENTVSFLPRFSLNAITTTLVLSDRFVRKVEDGFLGSNSRY